MSLQITPQKIYQVIKELPEDNLNEIWNFIEFMRFKSNKKSSKKNIKLGGILSEYNIDISEKDIEVARKEMWQNLGKINE